MIRCGLCAFLVLVLGLMISPAHAVLIAYEGFDYDPGTLAAANGGTGWGSAWTAGTVVSGSLGYSTLSTTGNSAVISGANGSISAYRDLAAAQGAGTYYVSFIGQRLSPHATLDDNTIRATSFQLHAGTGTSGDERLSAGKATTAAPNQTYNWSEFSDGNGALGAESTTPITDQSFILMQVIVADDTDGQGPGVSDDIARMWVNPSLTGSLGAPDVELNKANGDNHDYLFGRVRVFSGGTNGDGLYADFAIDEIRIGTTLADVGVRVPEPATLALLAMGVGMIFVRRRK
jgi:PEP-CTERM motif